MGRVLTRLVGLLLAACGLWTFAGAEEAIDRASIDAASAYATSQAAIGRQVGAHVLVDHRGTKLSLADLRGRPLVISLVYTSCATVCPVTTEHLRTSLVEARRALGQDSFAILTFGFNAAGDRPAQLAAFANTHRLLEIRDWRLASADPETTAALLRDVGFSYQYAAGGFDHTTQTTILDAEGRVYRQVYGEAFPLPVIMEPLKELVLKTETSSVSPSALWDRITFLCTVYNPYTRAYRFDYGIFFGMVIGGLSLLLTGALVLRLWLTRSARPSGQ